MIGYDIYINKYNKYLIIYDEHVCTYVYIYIPFQRFNADSRQNFMRRKWELCAVMQLGTLSITLTHNYHHHRCPVRFARTEINHQKRALGFEYLSRPITDSTEIKS